MLGRHLWVHPYAVWCSIRWLTWLVALASWLWAPQSGRAVRFEPMLLIGSACWLICLTTYPRWRSTSRPFLWLEERGLLPALEILISSSFVFFSGGWDSHYYEYALMSVIAPALMYGLWAGVLSAMFFSLLWWAIVAFYGWPSGPEARSIPSMVLNPWMVAYFSAVLAELIGRLHREQREVRRLAAREERYRLSRDLHDGVAQTLFMLSLSLEGARDRARGGSDEKLARKLGELHEIARQALWETRNAMFDPEKLLDPAVPLEQALERLVREWQSVSSIPIAFEHEGAGLELTAKQRVGLYRILQECLANVFKHSRATRVRLILRPDCLCVEDDGVGFDLASVPAGDGMRGRGLRNLRTRAEELGGALKVVSAPGQGTRVTINFQDVQN